MLSQSVFIALMTLVMTTILSACASPNFSTLNQQLRITEQIQLHRDQSFVISPHNHIALQISSDVNGAEYKKAVVNVSKKTFEKYFSTITVMNTSNNEINQARKQRANFMLSLKLLDSSTVKEKTTDKPSLEVAAVSIKGILYEVTTGEIIDVVIMQSKAGALTKTPRLPHLIKNAISAYAEQLVNQPRVVMQ